MKRESKATRTGFTIVELLIVIVVIAILATISIVAYNGIQNRANDTAIQSDLHNFAKKVQLAAVDLGSFPAGGATRSGGVGSGDSTTLPGFSFAPSKAAYMTTVANLYYCTGTETSSGQKIFRVIARSKSGNLFQYTSTDGLQNLGNTAASQPIACQGISEPYTYAYGYLYTTQTWWGWANG